MNNEIDGKSLDIRGEKLDQLKQLFPEFFAEGKLDLARVQQTLGDSEVITQDHYELSWAGKAEARREIQRQTTATLIPDKEGSVDFDTAENIFIEGENLEVLRTLQKAYFGRVKAIYIDPPYNTGSDSFVYPDDFAERLEEYEKRTGQKNGEGFLNKLDLFKKNAKENGQYHSAWLSMMYPRLYLARNLLMSDGLIFVSIDDNEVTNLKALMNEIFGEENFVSQIIIQSNKRGQTYKEVAKTHEYLLVYARGVDFEIFELAKKDDALPYTDSTGKFDLWELRNRNPKFGRHNRPNLYFPIYAAPDLKDENGYSKISLEKTEEFNVEVLPKNSEGVDSCWRWSVDLINRTETTGDTPVLIARKKQGGGWNVYEKSRKSTTKVKSLWTETAVISEQGTIELGELGLSNYFEHPKPVGLVKKVLQIATETDGLILDFFAGSGTTAQAVFELNQEDGGSRRFICVQMPEPTEETSEAYKAGYKTVSAICKTRIQKAIEKVKKDANGKLAFVSAQGNLAFQSYKLYYSNFKKWNAEITDKDDLLKQLAIFKEPLAKHPADSFDLLTELLLKSGIPLSAQIDRRITSDDVPYYAVEDNAIYALDSLSPELLKDVEAAKPSMFVTLGNLFTGEKADETMTNWKLQLQEADIDFKLI